MDSAEAVVGYTALHSSEYSFKIDDGLDMSKRTPMHLALVNDMTPIGGAASAELVHGSGPAIKSSQLFCQIVNCCDEVPGGLRATGLSEYSHKLGMYTWPEDSARIAHMRPIKAALYAGSCITATVVR